jgi:hypothetical protein
MSDDGVEVNAATTADGNGREEGWHNDIDDDEEFVAQGNANQYHDEQNVEDADNNLDDDEEVPLASVVRDPHPQDPLLKKIKSARRKQNHE